MFATRLAELTNFVGSDVVQDFFALVRSPDALLADSRKVVLLPRVARLVKALYFL